MSEPGRRSLAAYALPALSLAILTLPLYVLVPAFYARELALPLAAVGQPLLAVRLVDALSDPLVGVLADRWRPAFGRRRLWFALASVPTAVAAFFVFTPPADAGVSYLMLWGVILSVAWTAALVPYTAWGAELSTLYHGRARIAGWRETCALLGTLVALFAQVLVPLAGFPGERAVLLTIGIFILVTLPASALVTVVAVPEPRDLSKERLTLRDGLRHMRENRPFLRLILAFLLNGFANGFPATLFIFFVAEKLRVPDAAGPLLVLYFFCGVAGVPVWLKLAGRLSKHRAWCFAMLFACTFFAVAPFLGEGATLAFACVCIGTGFALGADLMLPPSIQADVIDVDTAASGEQRAGIYFAAWGLATKLALALAVGVAFPVLAASGFNPSASLRTDSGLAMLGFLYAGLPVVLKLAAIAVMWNFPIDVATHAQLRETIEARQRPVNLDSSAK
ncbi:MAG: putative symporter YjmB [Hyphomicrobiales bacterium]|nr:putative symporter YjmB [Hyphomicrobiales bacterium]